MFPDLDLPGDARGIVADNIRAVQAIWFAQQLEAMRSFDVLDRVVQGFQQGLLPLGRGAGRRLVDGTARLKDQLSTADRRGLFARALGLPGGDAAAGPRHDFHALWLRFISSVAQFERQRGQAVTAQSAGEARAAVWQAARALARQLSAHGAYAGGHFAAQRLADQVNALRDLLQTPELLRTFGARDMWQVIDDVTRNELGGAKNTGVRRQRAVAGSTLLQWLADHADALQRTAEPPAGVELPDPALRAAVARWLHLAAAGRGAAPAPAKTFGATIAAPAATAATAATAAIAATAVPVATLSAGVQLQTGSWQAQSRYIGETEKQLDKVFADAAQTAGVLLFDEADALLARRPVVKDAHDRFADADADAGRVPSPAPAPAPPAPALPAPAVSAPAAGGALRRQPPSTRRISRP